MKDTAFEVRRARAFGISVLGIFAGNYEDTAAEKKIFGKENLKRPSLPVHPCYLRKPGIQKFFHFFLFYHHSPENTAAEKKIFGKDFAYVRDISNFSHIVGTYLRRQLEE